MREIYTGIGRLWPAHRRLLLSAAALPCVSTATATASQFRGALAAQVIPDGLAIDPRRAPREASRAALGLAPEAPVIAVLGRISGWKGQDMLVRALAQAPLCQRSAIGLLAGDPWPGAPQRLERVLALAAQLGAADRLVTPGFIDDVAPSTAPPT